jgi:hypothetical protein
MDQWDQLFDRDSIDFDLHLVYRFEIYFRIKSEKVKRESKHNG